MKDFLIFFFIISSGATAQDMPKNDADTQALYQLIETYALAREQQDSVLLKSILTEDIDQLVSSGEWRIGLSAALSGMQQSTSTNPGSRSLIVEKIRFLSATTSLIDALYVITQTNGAERRMWSTFIAVRMQDRWKISAIRNMLPTGR
ncbi:DUF4440 domain-containing protein [Arenibacter sp. GZD96]|uniref:hypothetical protein n=1 Tax=Aurantibrevibacter litoralis TaxID=3106030 RepID=UPI002AFE5577|nr:hypothetical protein [Arenibacter sp. GZD-96]MEA1784961.1 DUF4440 domain-containing protein [Arenibacter sp. GZD-96]